MGLAPGRAVDLSQVWGDHRDQGGGPQVSSLRLQGRNVSATGPTYAFDRCDGCGKPLPEADRLWGFCSTCLCLPPREPPPSKAKPTTHRS